MSGCAIRETGAGQLLLSGVLDYRSGPQLRIAGQKLIRGSKSSSLLLDCSAVERSSSVGLSLLLAFIRDAQGAGKALSLKGLPEDMRQIAEVSGLTELLPLEA